MATDPKPLPVPTLSKLIPPSNEHTFFAGFRDFPFDPSNAEFSLAKAWWLAEASLLAYGDEPFVRRKLNESGLADRLGIEPRFFVGTMRGAQCVLLISDDFVTVAFRGTRIHRVSDPVLNLRLWLINEVDFGTDVDVRLNPETRAHSGFSRAFEDVCGDLSDSLRALGEEKPSRPFWFTGHSLGAALATLAADRFGGDNAKGLYTFGSPRVGDESFAARFRVPCYRFVNNTDLIPHLPPPGYPTNYAHVGNLKFIDASGRILGDPKTFDILDSNVRGHLQAVKTGILAFNSENLRDAGKAMIDGFRLRNLAAISESIERLNLDFVPLASLVDHAPLNYSVHVWNALTKEIG